MKIENIVSKIETHGFLLLKLAASDHHLWPRVYKTTFNQDNIKVYKYIIDKVNLFESIGLVKFTGNIIEYNSFIRKEFVITKLGKSVLQYSEQG